MQRRIIVACIVVAALAAAGTAYAVVAHSSATTATITACVSEDGQLRLAPQTGVCKKNEQLLTWNTVGPAGLTGPAGPAGAAGAAGPAGPQGAAGRDGRDATSSNPDAVVGTVTAVAQVSGTIADGVAITAVSHEIISPRDPASGLPTGQRIHKPITITTAWGASTPLFISVLTRNENLKSVEIDLQQGGTIKLTNASVSDYQQHGNNATFSFTYQKIEWDIGNTAVSDDWEVAAS